MKLTLRYKQLIVASFIFFIMITYVQYKKLKCISVSKFVNGAGYTYGDYETKLFRLLIRPECDTALISPEKLCRYGCPTIMVVVTSAPANFQRRQAIRESWAKDQEDSDTEVLFLLGKQQDAIQQAHIFY